jgi:integrase
MRGYFPGYSGPGQKGYPQMPVTDTKICTAKATAKPYKLADEHRLYLPGQPERRQAVAPQVPIRRQREAPRARDLSRCVVEGGSRPAGRSPRADCRGIDPAALRKATKIAGKEGHFAAVTEPTQIAPLLRALDSYSGTLIVCCALRLAPLVFVRPGELRNARWADYLDRLKAGADVIQLRELRTATK